jgi:hypothetical protein
MRHRVAKGVVGLAAGLAAICLLSLPTAAATATLEFINLTGTTPGTITVFNADEEEVTSIPVPGTGETCSTGSTDITVTTTGTSSTTSGSGTIHIDLTSLCSVFYAGSTWWCSHIVGGFSGTWTHSTTSTNTFTSNPGSTTGTSTPLVVQLRKNTGTSPDCHSVTTTFCTITIYPFAVSGIITSPGMELATSDTATVAGSNFPGDLSVSGTATTCGIFIAANNGSASINAKVHVVP